MSEVDHFNMSMRKFLKQVGVTSQSAIENSAARYDGPGPIKVKMVLTSENAALEHVIEGEIAID